MSKLTPEEARALYLSLSDEEKAEIKATVKSDAKAEAAAKKAQQKAATESVSTQVGTLVHTVAQTVLAVSPVAKSDSSNWTGTKVFGVPVLIEGRPYTVTITVTDTLASK